MKDLSNDLIIGWPTLKGTGLLAVVLGLEEYKLEEDKDDDGLGELWEASEDPTYGPPTVKGSAEEVRRIQALCEEFKHLFGPPPNGGCKLPPIDIELKQDSNGRYMEPRRMQARYVSPWINELIREGMIANRLKHSWEESITCENTWGLISPNSLCQSTICSRKTQVSIGQKNANSVTTRSRKEQHKM